MSFEIYNNIKNARIITSEQFIEFISSFSKPIICQVCGNQQWTVSVTYQVEAVEGQPKHTVIETIGYAQLKAEEDSALNYPGGLPVIRMTCGCCGNLLLFSYKAVRNLIVNKENSGENNNGQ